MSREGRDGAEAKELGSRLRLDLSVANVLPGEVATYRPRAVTRLGVWEGEGWRLLAAIAAERDAWVAAVLANPAGGDLDRYLATSVEGEV